MRAVLTSRADDTIATRIARTRTKEKPNGGGHDGNGVIAVVRTSASSDGE